jgi:transitional endoplasmic reticulum ATPase
MPDPGYELRPDAETFDYAGCRVALVDAPGILEAARSERVELLHDAVFPLPVRQVRYWVATGVRDGRPVHLLEAEVHTSAGGLDWLGPAVLGNDPIGALLARRLAAGDPRVGRIVDSVGNAAVEAYRRLGLGRPAGGKDPEGPVVREDPETGLRATVTYEASPTPDGPSGPDLRVTALRAVVASDAITGAHLRAMFCLVLQVVADLAGDARRPRPLAGHSYVLSRYPDVDSPDPAERIGPGAERIDLDQVGGLPGVVAQFRQIAVSFRHPEVMARWGARRPQGILMYGPPGTGKTMLARALASEIGANFREIRTPEILDKWLGASERNIKRIFREARRYREPTVMLFDEFDSIISYAGLGGDAASQAVNAVAGIFKQEMNNLIDDNPNVIVVATTNFPHRVDDSLIRSGRFDLKLAIPLPDETGRAEIITKMIRQLIARHEVAGFRMFADDLDPQRLARASHGMTGADLKEVLRRVQLAKAMQEARSGTRPPPISQDEIEGRITELRHAGAQHPEGHSGPGTLSA